MTAIMAAVRARANASHVCNDPIASLGHPKIISLIGWLPRRSDNCELF